MSPSHAEAATAELLRDDNYFAWEFNARMKLAKKNLLVHLDATKAPQEGDPMLGTWQVNDMKAFAIVSTMIDVRYQSMVRNCQTAAEAWMTLKNFFVRQSVHNRVQVRRQLHEFKMAKGSNIMDHLMKFDELCLSLATIGDAVSESEQLVILLGSLPDDYDAIIKIIENISDMTLFTAKEMLRREYDEYQRKEAKESALKAAQWPRKGFKSHGKTRFNGKCFLCGKFGHKKNDCYKNSDEGNGKGEKQEHAFSAATNGLSSGWLLDSGASSHMCPVKNEFASIELFKEPVPISIANGWEVKALGTGNVPLTLKDGTLVRMYDVLFVPDLDRRLMSISALVKKGLKIRFEKKCCVISNEESEIVRVERDGKLYILDCKARESAFASVEPTHEAGLWHARLGHYPISKIKKLSNCVEGLEVSKIPDDLDLCEGCANGKLSVQPFPTSRYGEVKTDKILQIVHSDVMGPMKTVSQGGAKYVVTFIDDFSRYTVVYFMAQKSEVVDKFAKYKAMMENQFDTKIKCLRTDNGKEFINKKMGMICSNAGIIHQTTIPYTPQQNGLAERMNRTIVERARAMIEHMQVDPEWWAEAVNTAVYITNRLPCAAHPDSTPFRSDTWNKT